MNDNKIITGCPDTQPIDIWIENLPSKVKVSNNGIAAIIASWRYTLGLKPVEIEVVKC